MKNNYVTKFGILILLFACTALAQTPIPMPQPLHLDCTSPISPTLHVQMDLDANPMQQLRLVMSNVVTPSTDVTPPVISGVAYSGGASVLTNTGRILATANGVPFTVSAGDDVGVSGASLYVDGVFVTNTFDMSGVLPNVFYLRWNSRLVAVGPHNFRLVLYDSAGNSAEKSFSMVR